MDLTFIIGWTLNIIVIAMCLGVSYKLWVYGSRDLLLLSSPFIIFFILVIVPIFVWNLIIFRFDSLLTKINEEIQKAAKRPIEEIKLPLSTKIRLAAYVTRSIYKDFPSLSGSLAKSISKHSVNVRFRSIIEFSIRQTIFSFDRLGYEKMWRKYV